MKDLNFYAKNLDSHQKLSYLQNNLKSFPKAEFFGQNLEVWNSDRRGQITGMWRGEL